MIGAKIVLKVLNAAIANAVDQGDTLKVEPDDLFVKNAWVDGGPTIKRFRAPTEITVEVRDSEFKWYHNRKKVPISRGADLTRLLAPDDSHQGTVTFFTNGTDIMYSSIEIWGSSMMRIRASQTSRRLWGGIEVAMPTAIPLEPLTSRLGNRAGRTVGSVRLSS